MTLKSKLVADEHPLIVLPHLAAEVDLIRERPTADSLLVNQQGIRRIIKACAGSTTPQQVAPFSSGLSPIRVITHQVWRCDDYNQYITGTS